MLLHCLFHQAMEEVLKGKGTLPDSLLKAPARIEFRKN
jgi:hypothetical protein